MSSVEVEIILKTYSENFQNSVRALVEVYLHSAKIRPNSVITNLNRNEHVFHDEVRMIIVGDIPSYDKLFIDFKNVDINWFIYTLSDMGPIPHIESDEQGDFHVATYLTLPSAELYNAWENLYYNNDIKQNLLKYARTMMEFADKGVDLNVISCNKLILLHGPPGTGKTSLCKALAHKLTIRMHKRYQSGFIVEINSHSLFSKWFSESGKLVTKMFSKIKEMVEKPDVLVCVLMDEIESLAHDRSKFSANEPLDSVRVVNALITQIDQIRRYPNVLILATSNMTETIDLAFVDRADIKQYLGLPSEKAIYKIYHSCLVELIKAQIIVDSPDTNGTASQDLELPEAAHLKLMMLCEKSIGLSGRSLRKIPFIAHALFLSHKSRVNIYDFVSAMEAAVQREKTERMYFEDITKIKV